MKNTPRLSPVESAHFTVTATTRLPSIIAMAMVFFLLVVLPGRAATANWTNSTAGDSYTNKNSWSTAAVPGGADTAVIGNATVATASVVYTNSDAAGTNALAGLTLGGAASGSGTLAMSAGQLTITNSATVATLGSAAAATGNFTNNGGTLIITNTAGANALILGNNGTGTGNFVLNSGNVTLVRPSTAGQMFQDGFQVGNSGVGTYTQNGGTNTVLCGIEIGSGGIGTININGGTIIDNGWFGVGRGGNGSGNKQAFVNITGGTVYLLRNPGNEGGLNSVSFCQGATNGSFTMSGGTLYCNAFRFRTANLTNDWATMNFSGGDIYLGPSGIRDNQDGSNPAGGTHNISINLSGGTFHTVNMGPNPGGTNLLNSIGPNGTNWSWAADLPATLNTSPGSGIVTFAPEAGKIITLNNNFSGSGGLTFAGPGTVVVNGANNYSGATTISGGTVAGSGTVGGSTIGVSSVGTVSPGLGTTPATLTLGGAATMNGSTNIIKLSADPTQIGNAINDLIAVSASLTLQGTITVKIVPLGPLSTSSPYTIMTYSGTPLTSADAAHLHVISDSPRYNFTVVDPSTTPGSIQISITGNAANLVWRGANTATGTRWDSATPNWLNTATSLADTFFSGDAVGFDDAGNTNFVVLTGSLQPTFSGFTNNSKDYTLAGGGPLSGVLDLEGSKSVTLAMTNPPNFGSITLNSGALICNLPLSSYQLTGNISDNGSGGGSLVKAGTNTLVLAQDNSFYTGAIIVTNGTLQFTNAVALGASAAPLFVTNGGILDLSGLSAGIKNVQASGTGFNGLPALYNSGAGLANAGIGNINLLGDTTIGAINRWDSFQNSFNGNGFTLTEIGPGSNLLVDDGNTGIGGIHIAAGRLGFQGLVNMGDPAKACVVESNATLTFFSINDGGANKVLVLKGGATFDSGGAAGTSNTFYGPVFVTGTNLVGVRVSLRIPTPISDTNGAGGIVLGNDAVGASGGDLYLDGANTYSGVTIITNRTLYVGASSSLGTSSTILVVSPGTLNVTSQSSFPVGSGQTLAGSGTVAANTVALGIGATLAPGLGGNNTASLTVNGTLTLAGGSTNVVVVNKTTSVANSKTIGLTSVTMGGTLVVNSVGSALAGGDAIPIFNSTGYGGSFGTIVPSTPGNNLLWDTTTLASDGTLRVKSTVNTTPTNIVATVSGNQLTLTWPSDHTGWTLQAQTNSITGSWNPVPGSTTTNQMFIPIDRSKTDVFYRLMIVQ